MWRGAEHNDQRMDYKSKLEIEIGEKKKRKICVFLREKGRRRPPDAFKLGRVGTRNVPGMFFWRYSAESSEPITDRHLATGGCYMAETTRHYSSSEREFKANEIPVRKRDSGAFFSRYFCDYILH